MPDRNIPYKKEDEDILQDSISSFRMSVLTNTPYSGPLGYLPGYGFIGYSIYQPANILIAPSASPLEDRKSEADLSEILKDSSLLVSIFDFFAHGASTIQANDFFIGMGKSGNSNIHPSPVLLFPVDMLLQENWLKLGKPLGMLLRGLV